MLRSKTSRAVVAGAVAGLIATVPMTVAMGLWHRRLPWYQRYASPPKLITRQVAESVGLRRYMDREAENTATTMSHLGYGSLLGTLYGLVADALPGTPVSKGVGYGLFVWAANYLVGLPASNFSAAATREPMKRNAMMIVAHVVWGASLGPVFAALDAAGSPQSAPARSRTTIEAALKVAPGDESGSLIT